MSFSSKLHHALSYMLNNWDQLISYVNVETSSLTTMLHIIFDMIVAGRRDYENMFLDLVCVK